ALNDIRSQLDFVKGDLPDGASDPMLFKFSSSMAPVMVIGVSSPDMTVEDLYALTEKQVLDKFRQASGVGSAFASGRQKSVNIRVDIPSMQRFNVTLSQITNAVKANNLNAPLGEIKEGKMAYSVRIPGEYESIEEIKKTVIGATSSHQTIYLEDVAEVTFSSGEMESVSKIRNSDGIIIIVQKQSGANTIEVANELKKKMDEVKNIYPEGTKMDVLYDTSLDIENSINNLLTTVLFAFIFVILVVLIFLRNFRGSLIIALAIPFSLIIAFIYLYFSGSSINVISLASISIAIGMVVDNSIVVLENIFRHRDEENEKIRHASYRGTGEVVTAIMASTFTTIAIFIPLLFVGGLTSVLFEQLAYTVSIVLLGSLITSTTLTPMLSSRILRHLGHKKTKFEQKSENVFIAVESGYSRFLNFALKHKKFILFSAVIVFILSLMIVPSLKTEFLPSEDSSLVFGTVKLIPGMRIEETSRIIDSLNITLPEEIPEFTMWSMQAGLASGGGMQSDRNSYTITVIGKLKIEENGREYNAIINNLRAVLNSYPEVKSSNFSAGGPGGRFMGGGKQIQIEVYGNEVSEIFSIARNIKNKMEDIEGFVDISLSRDEAFDNISIIPRKERMSSTGMNTAFLMQSLYAGINGSDISVFRKDGFEYDINLAFDRKYLTSINDLAGIPVYNPMGMSMPLAAVAEIKRTKEPPLIERKDAERFVKIEANVDGIAISEGALAINEIIADTKLPDGVRIEQGGDIESQQESFRDLGIAILLGIVLVFLVMAGQFESFIDPFIIIFSLPFAFVGVIWALFITNTALSVMGFIGMLMLVGIVVNNAIVLVDFTNQLRLKGMPVSEAVPLAGKTRLRPVLMTALTTMSGLMALAVSTGSGSALWRPLGIVVVGGLLVATLVTLIIIPVLYSIAESRIKRRREEV
ncbi:MAG: efflux RND transporter permease subunit, partial [candidate division WOR-3 bacterium]|nr:efflux RND transporter permease subunit [candidate division WOR-3 bacterium]